MPPIHSYTRLMQHENGPEAHLFPQTADMGMAKAGKSHEFGGGKSHPFAILDAQEGAFGV